METRKRKQQTVLKVTSLETFCKILEVIFSAQHSCNVMFIYFSLSWQNKLYIEIKDFPLVFFVKQIVYTFYLILQVL